MLVAALLGLSSIATTGFDRKGKAFKPIRASFTSNGHLSRKAAALQTPCLLVM
jgi:hypothetical protein